MNRRLNQPLSLLQQGIPYSYPSLRRDIHTDILIIGAGITGSLIAHQCMEMGFVTTIIDKREVGSHATATSTSILQYELDTSLLDLTEQKGKETAENIYKACYLAIDQMELLVKKIKSNCQFKRKDALYFASWKKDVEVLEKEYELRRKNGFAVKWISSRDIQKLYEINNSYGGILSKQAATFDAYKFTHDLLQYNLKRGLQVYDKTDVSKINYKTNKITAKTEFGNTILAKKIIYCNGIEAIDIIEEQDIDCYASYVIASEPIPNLNPNLEKLIAWNTTVPYYYFRTTDDRRILFGGEDEKIPAHTDPSLLLDKKAEKLEKQINKYMSHTPFFTDFSWAGSYAETKDQLPYIGTHATYPSTYFVLGFGSNGILFSLLGMNIIEALFTSTPHPLINEFKFGR